MVYGQNAKLEVVPISWKGKWGEDHTEEYYLTDYYKDGVESNGAVKVYISRSDHTYLPYEFNTSGYNRQLHFGCLWMGGDQAGVFFAIHPNSNRPLQKKLAKQMY